MSLQHPEPGTNSQEPLKIWNCVNCRRRKLRCDRRHPCAPCTKSKIDCHFPISGRIPSRSRLGDRAPQKQVELVGRLRRLEAMVGGLSSQVESAAGMTANDLPLPGSIDSTSVISSEQSSNTSNEVSEAPRADEDFGVLEVASNGDLVVGEGFWTVFCKEVEDIFEAVQGHTVMHFDDGRSSSMSEVAAHTGYYNFLLRSTYVARQKKELYPLPSQMLFIWQIYMDNIDPFIKVLHVPSITKVVQEIRSSYDSLSPSMQALLLAVSLASIMSLEENEASITAYNHELFSLTNQVKVKANFHIEKTQLLAQYRLGTEQALGQADFLNNPDMILLQALAIYLSVLQHTGEVKTTWVLTGVLVRAAVSMKLHLEGSKVNGSNPFDIQMRRRLWWQICLIDSRSGCSQLSAFKLSESMFDTEKPANTNDEALGPSLLQVPPGLGRWTGMSIFLLRCQVWSLSRQLQCVTDITQKRELFKKGERGIEAKYLANLDTTRPIQAFIRTSVRIFFAKVNLMLLPRPRHKNGLQPLEPIHAQEEFSLCMAVIDHTYALQSEPGWSGWRWQIQGQQPPWHALRIVLGHLSSSAWKPDYDQALTSVRRSLDRLTESFRADTRYNRLRVQLSVVESMALQHHEGSSQSINMDGDGLWTENLNISSSGEEMDWQAWNDIAGDLELWAGI